VGTSASKVLEAGDGMRTLGGGAREPESGLLGATSGPCQPAKRARVVFDSGTHFQLFRCCWAEAYKVVQEVEVTLTLAMDHNTQLLRLQSKKAPCLAAASLARA
jgi:hypothetical protein